VALLIQSFDEMGTPCVIVVVTHWGVIANVTKQEVSNCDAVLTRWSRGPHGHQTERMSKKFGTAADVAAELGWRFTVDGVYDSAQQLDLCGMVGTHSAAHCEGKITRMHVCA